ncbi:MAG: hypothetical protein WC935_02425 [Thermoleophilia bacterium]
MAKFSRFLLGGAIGAGLAFLLSRKDVRHRLMGGGQPQLPAANETAMGTATGSATTSVDLESRIEESRRQVEASLEEPFAKAVADEKEAEIMEAVIGEPAIAAPVEEDAGTAEAGAPPLVEEDIASDQMEEGPAETVEVTEASGESASGEVAETVVEEMLTEEEERPADVVVQEEAATAQEAPKSARVTPDESEAAAPVSVEDEFATLSTPAEGEPTMGESGDKAVDAPEPLAKPEPTRLDRDEMKKRIDETRARLKAKAFDAMVSGETFVTPDTGEPIKATEPGVEIDEETGDQINRSLKEED